MRATDTRGDQPLTTGDDGQADRFAWRSCCSGNADRLPNMGTTSAPAQADVGFENTLTHLDKAGLEFTVFHLGSLGATGCRKGILTRRIHLTDTTTIGGVHALG